jgi:hypothetical protein
MEALIVSETIAAESGHWYDARTGAPMYEVPYASGKGMRSTTLADARKLNLVPSVTLILRCASAPGLDAWKAKQILMSALTLPQLPDEPLDDYAKRVVEDSQAQSEKAKARGTSLHKAIEDYITGTISPEWKEHLIHLDKTLEQYGIDLHAGKPEHTFASPYGYGGKLDWHDPSVMIDFKTKDNLTPKKLAYPEHCWQLSAYDYGLGMTRRRLLSVFIGCYDREIRIHEWTPEDSAWGWKCFVALLSFWKVKNKI